MTNSRRSPRALVVFLAVLTILFLLASLGARLGHLHWWGDMLALFIELFFFVSLFLLLAWFFLASRVWIALAATSVLLNGFLLLPYFPSARAVSGSDLTLYVHNLYYQNESPEAALAELRRYDPDFIYLMEYNNSLRSTFEDGLDDYPHRLIEPSSRTMGVAVFSRVPFEASEVVRFNATRIPIVDVSIEVNGESVRFVGAHPWPPLGHWGSLHRAQMQSVTRVAAAQDSPLIVAGDFNASPWSFVFRELAYTAQVKDAALRWGFAKSWQLSPFFKLPLDHVLVSDDWQVLEFKQGQASGSDHKPLITKLKLE